MNKLYTLLTIMLAATTLSAQSPNYVDFEWDIFKFGYVIPTSGDNDGGLTFGGEVRYNATDNFSIGLAFNGAVFGTDFGDNVDLGVSGSSLMVGDYYLKTDSSTRPFVGLGLGLYSSGTLTIRNGNSEEVIDGSSGFGFAPRAGYEFGHVRLQGQYNLALDEAQPDYLELTLAFTLWGGYNGN